MSDYIYYNGSIVCNKSNLADLDLKAVFSDETIEPIVANASDYLFAIARYDMKVPTLPILECTVQPNQGNVNLLSYGIRISGTISSSPVDSTMTNLVYLPRNNRLDSQGYYFIYNYDHFCDMVNVCFATCASAISSSVSPPKLAYDPSSNLFSIYTDDSAYDLTNGSNTEQLTIQFNQELFNLLRHFNYLYNSDNSVDLIVTNKIGNVIGTSPTYIINTQNSPSTGTIWSPVGNILFESDGMQLNNEIVGNTSVITSSSVYSSLGSAKSNTEQNSITDIVVNLNSSMDYNSNITYVPSIYRWIDLYRITNLNKISFSVYWRHKNSNSIKFPVLMPNGSVISIKIHFKKRLIN
jgi:hypothetical protein